ncbi:MAG: CidA/LrgA family protein [Burkholderiaceae bacterium]|nr:CidA/LrgA family protein [Burkholderiaceae bacterium]
MIRGLVYILLFQGLGEIISKALALPIPGPVIGLLLLLATLVVRDRLDPDLDQVASTFSQHLGLLFIPAAVGVVMFVPKLREHGLTISLILAASVGLAIGATAFTLRLLGPKPTDDARAGSPEKDT